MVEISTHQLIEYQKIFHWQTRASAVGNKTTGSDEDGNIFKKPLSNQRNGLFRDQSNLQKSVQFWICNP